jgi:hypothetical protein
MSDQPRQKSPQPMTAPRVGVRIVLVLLGLSLVFVGFLIAVAAVFTVMGDCAPSHPSCNPLDIHLIGLLIGLLISSLGILLIRRLSP